MSKIGIISGGGKLPIVIGKNLINSGNSVIFFCIETEVNKNDYDNFDKFFININSLSKIIKNLKLNKIKNLIFAGNINRPSLKDINFDFKTIKLIKQYALQRKGDDKLLSSIVKFFEKEGFNFINWKNKCSDLFIRENFITNKRPNKISIENLQKGLEIFDKIGKADLSQSLIIQNKIILGIEAAEGTDELIKRCNKYKKKGDKGILLKLSKYNQDNRFDVPVIGIKTVKQLKKYDYEGVFIEKNRLIILDKNQVIEYCNKNSLFISGVIKTWIL